MSLDGKQRGSESDLNVAKDVSGFLQSSSRQGDGCLMGLAGLFAEVGAYLSLESGNGALAVLLGIIGAVCVVGGGRKFVRG